MALVCFNFFPLITESGSFGTVHGLVSNRLPYIYKRLLKDLTAYLKGKEAIER